MSTSDPQSCPAFSAMANLSSAVTAVYKGTPRGGPPALLRSYDSRREPSPEFDCKIWQAGRATCAIGLAFKPIQIGQSVFHDDGAGNFNPSVTALNEAVVNEWPGREVGVFVSVGTGKRPKSSDANSSLWYEGFLGEFAEARRKLITKIEGCERIHELLKREYLAKRGVSIDHYYRWNVEVGVGEFGMNEWNRLVDISTNTRRYLAREEEQKMVQGASAKLAKIHFAKQRWERLSMSTPDAAPMVPEIAFPLAIELPGDVPMYPPSIRPSSHQSYDSGNEMLPVRVHTPSPRSSGEPPRYSPKTERPPYPHAPPIVAPLALPSRVSGAPSTTAASRPEEGGDDSDRLMVSAPTPSQYRIAAGTDKIAITAPDDHPRRYPEPVMPQMPPPTEPPPLPPKTPLPEYPARYGRGSAPVLPYPVDEDAPPMVNMARKPNYSAR